ncbi:PREDICTED: uncharacterized protein C9orf9 homolog [Condylura cristata]|uniref:uncharacterized protein C9orf9 homolog n=1 Tax=Condylura cristata TaxID=143302 RepID=UPI0003345E9C|nr:PREDICTED: uncharacterized protein C9orf9 homolog [Condylura cristata]
MNEVKESLRNVEQRYRLFQQQQFTFVSALEHCREDAHDKIRPISSIGQVQDYMDHHCHNSTSRRVLLMFLDICAELNRLCQHFEALHTGTPVTNNLLEKCKTLVSQSNDLSNLRAKYPHDVVNHLSCDEAKNHYGGVVSLIPLVLDLMKEWVAHSEKLPRKALQHVSARQACQEAAAGPRPAGVRMVVVAQGLPSGTAGLQPRGTGPASLTGRTSRTLSWGCVRRSEPPGCPHTAQRLTQRVPRHTRHRREPLATDTKHLARPTLSSDRSPLQQERWRSQFRQVSPRECASAAGLRQAPQRPSPGSRPPRQHS